MKIGRVNWNGRTTAALFDNGKAYPIPEYTIRELIDKSEREKAPLTELIAERAAKHDCGCTPILPVAPSEVWACGCTYEMSASFRDAEHGTREGFYRHVFTAPRPEIFFKGTARFCVGPGEKIGIREDSSFTAPEPELAVLLGSRGRILGYALANDVSAWDIERENPLYLPQSKMYNACCAIGPWFVTPDELTDPYNIEMTCTIRRGERLIFEGSCSTAKLGRKIESLVEYLLRSNPVPAGAVLLTGTGIIATQEAALAPGDIVTVSAPELGALVNEAAIV